MSQCEIVGTDILIEFLEIAFNNILYARKLYPAETFVMKKTYGTATYVSRHPELNEYIANVLKTLGQWIASDRSSVSAVNIKFFDKHKCLVEKYVFNLIDIEDEHRLLRRDPYFMKLEQLLRSLSLRLSMAMSYLNPLPDESTFSVDIDARQWTHAALCASSMSQNFEWILNPELNFSEFLPSNEITRQREDLCKNSSLLPLIAINNCCLRLELFVVEVNEKRRSLEA